MKTVLPQLRRELRIPECHNCDAGKRLLTMSTDTLEFSLTLRSSPGHHRRDLRENHADAARYARHYGTGAHGDETSHQGVFNEVLTFAVKSDSEIPNCILERFHFLSPFLCFQDLTTIPSRPKVIVFGAGGTIALEYRLEISNVIAQTY
jgi:hypothetical protein